MADQLHSLRILSATRNLGKVRRFVARHAREVGFSDQVVEQVTLAVDEACSNVIRHAYGGRKNGPVDIAVIVEPEVFTVAIRDEGRAFEPGKYQSPDLNRSIRNRRPGGFGIYMMRKLMDEVQYHSDGLHNEVRLSKTRPDPKEKVLNGH